MKDKDKRYTTEKMYQELSEVFSEKWKDAYDPCPRNPTFDGLRSAWKGIVYCNPPFSELKAWAFKMVEEIEKGNCQKCLLIVPWYAIKKRSKKAVSKPSKYFVEMESIAYYKHQSRLFLNW